MYFSRVASLSIFLTSILAQRPADQSVCDYYTTALFKDNTAANQKTLLIKLVNTAVIGNYTTEPAPKNAVPGILAPEGNLLKYFDGSLESTNRDDKPTSVNFLDDGGAEPLQMDKPANSESSRQYRLLTHLYEYFGKLLGCTQGDDYQGDNGMFAVHKYMDLSNEEITYFIQQVGLSAASFGVTQDDITGVATALNNTFNRRCSPKSDPIKKGLDLQAMCIASDCTLAEGATCGDYPNNGTGVEPQSASMSATSGSAMPSETGSGSAQSGGNGTETGGASSQPTAGAPTAAGTEVRVSVAMLAVSGLFVVAFM